MLRVDRSDPLESLLLEIDGLQQLLKGCDRCSVCMSIVAAKVLILLSVFLLAFSGYNDVPAAGKGVGQQIRAETASDIAQLTALYASYTMDRPMHLLEKINKASEAAVLAGDLRTISVQDTQFVSDGGIQVCTIHARRLLLVSMPDVPFLTIVRSISRK